MHISIHLCTLHTCNSFIDMEEFQKLLPHEVTKSSTPFPDEKAETKVHTVTWCNILMCIIHKY